MYRYKLGLIFRKAKLQGGGFAVPSIYFLPRPAPDSGGDAIVPFHGRAGMNFLS